MNIASREAGSRSVIRVNLKSGLVKMSLNVQIQRRELRRGAMMSDNLIKEYVIFDVADKHTRMVAYGNYIATGPVRCELHCKDAKEEKTYTCFNNILNDYTSGHVVDCARNMFSSFIIPITVKKL